MELWKPGTLEPLTSSLHAARSSALDSAFLEEIRTFLESAFDDFSDADWAHAIGGEHVWIAGPAGLISHASLVARSLVCDGRPVKTGYVEAVATAAAFRRRGHGTTVMRRLADLINEQFEMGALSTGTPAFYQTLGWELWQGPTLVAGPTERIRTPDDDGSIMILRTDRSPRLDLNGAIVCGWRPGDVW